MRYAPVVLLAAPLLTLACGRILEDDGEVVNTDTDAGAATTEDGGASQREASTVDSDAQSTEADAGYHFPFAMTFEQALFGPDGANEPTNAQRADSPIFGSSSPRVFANKTITIVRTFPAQDDLFVSFYVRFGATPGTSIVAHLEDDQGRVVSQIVAKLLDPTSTVALSVRADGAELSMGNAAPGVPYRLGFHTTSSSIEDEVTVRAYGGENILGYHGVLQAAAGSPSKIVLGNLSAASGLDATFDDVIGQLDDFAPPSQ